MIHCKQKPFISATHCSAIFPHCATHITSPPVMKTSHKASFRRGCLCGALSFYQNCCFTQQYKRIFDSTVCGIAVCRPCFHTMALWNSITRKSDSTALTVKTNEEEIYTTTSELTTGKPLTKYVRLCILFASYMHDSASFCH